MAEILYQGHGSFRLTTSEGSVIYIDPYAGEGYDRPADWCWYLTSITTTMRWSW